MIIWHHIMDRQPEHGEEIVQLDLSPDGHHFICMRTYNQECSFQELLEAYAEYVWGEPDFFWIYAKDFPLPDKS